ncbi:GTP-dependent dephospho-CoA kinase family protein [Candidatus Bathyarchaeota archaeon]|nr:GTP-dependent dephospho-CoA kinase family protein [Candidatus Bathyarchaeota archaeon]
MIQYKPNQADIPRLKEPFGTLIKGEPPVTMPKLKQLVKEQHPVRVIAVGDVVSRETLAAGIPVDLRIIDHISMRKPSASFKIEARNTYNVKNPPGVITQESWDAIRQAMREHDVLILVDGEEDLLTLPCIVESRDNSLILYGQPSEGLVVVTASPNVKKEAAQILSRMLIEET